MKKFALGAAVAAMTLAGISAASAEDIVIGVAGPFTGPNAAFGEQLKRGAEQAAKDINAAGGINGKTIKLEYGDDASDPRQGVSAAGTLAQKKAVAVIGHFNSSVSIPASDVYAEEKIIQITPASTNPTLTDRGAKYSNVFRTVGRDDQQGEIAGKYVESKFKGKKVAIVHDKTTYGKGLADEFKKAYNAAGGKEVMYEGITTGDKDFSALVTKMKQAGVDVIYYGGLHNEAGLIIRQTREQGSNAQLVSGDGIVTEEFWSITGKAGEGTIMTFSPDPSKIPAAKPVIDRFKAANYNPEGYTLYSYAALQVYALAANKAKSTKMEDVEKTLKTGSYDTVVGPLSFDKKGDLTTAAYVWYIWKDGKYTEM